LPASISDLKVESRRFLELKVLPMRKSAFILGGTGQIGRAVAANLLGRGWQVTLAHRGRRLAPDDLITQGARVVVFDRADVGALDRALGSGTDVLIDTVAYDERHAAQLLNVQDRVGQFVVISSSSVYRDEAGRTLDEARTNGFPTFPQPLREDQPTVAPGTTTYSTRKVALERHLLDHARPPVTILRPCAIHGPHSVHPREWWFVKRIRDGRVTIPLAYRGESRFHTSAAVNIAALVGTVAAQPSTRILNIADPEVLTVAEIGASIAGHLGWRGLFRLIDDDTYPPHVGTSPWSVPAPFVLDVSKACALGYQPVADYKTASAATCAWLRHADLEEWRTRFPVLAAYPRDLFDYEKEDGYD
jgi:nucleoside-diphosphate-sugar epimerase